MGTDIIPIETVGADIAARIGAGDKAMTKADEHYLAAGIQLLEARTRLQRTREMRWSAFLFSCCRGLSSSRAYELINVAEGKTTSEEIREKARVRKQRFEARNREARDVVSSVPNGRSETTTAPPIEKPSDDSGVVEKLKATIAKLREQLEIKESQRRMAESEAIIARKQRDEAQNRAMFAEADKERLSAELAEAKDTIARLMADIDTLTKPQDTASPDTLDDLKRIWARVEQSQKPCLLEWMEKNVKPEPDDTLTDDQIPAFLKKDAA